MDDFSLEPIMEFQMPPLQAKAYKVGLIWMVLSRKHFPHYKHSKGYPKKGDPRKSALFKYCFKLIRETQGLIPDNEYRFYVLAQLQVLKAIDVGGHHPRIEPTCLAGDKAWVRWRIWKRKYDVVTGRATEKSETSLDITPLSDILAALQRTKTFLEGRFNGSYREENILMATKDLERWIALGKVSPFYAILSPWAKKHCKSINFDLTVQEKSVTPELTEEFKALFANEFSGQTLPADQPATPS